jgi:cobalt-zinc-cadmium efflux system membrane fusion protein
MQLQKTATGAGLVTGVVILVLIAGYYFLSTSKAKDITGAPSASPNYDKVVFNDKQLKSIEVNAVSSHAFSQQRTAVGSVDFNENLSVQVFPPYQGKIIRVFADIGDQVGKGAPLYTIDSPDLVQAESTLIAAAGVYDLTTIALKRAKDLHDNQGLAQKDVDQAISDQQTADAAFKAARDAVRVFGKTEVDIGTIVTRRKIDSALVVASPISGRVTARVAQPGLLVQPGNSTAPLAVADLATMWMIANVSESDSPLFHTGQDVNVKVMAFSNRDFKGKIDVIGATVDPSTRTVQVRSTISDPHHELKPGMFATYVIRTSDPVTSLAIPPDGVARESDGTMSVWVTTDHHTFNKRTVTIGQQQDGFDQILSGVKAGEIVVTKGAVFLSNMANANSD